MVEVTYSELISIDVDDLKTITSVIIPPNTKWLRENAFRECSSITRITVPNGCTSIGNKCFYGCTSLEVIQLPNSVVEIGALAFRSCSSLRSLIIPDQALVDNQAFGRNNGTYMNPFHGCYKLNELAASFSMTIKDYIVNENKIRMGLRVALLTSLAVYQKMTESVPPGRFPTYELLDGHLDGPRAYHKITAFELWREIAKFL